MTAQELIEYIKDRTDLVVFRVGTASTFLIVECNNKQGLWTSIEALLKHIKHINNGGGWLAIPRENFISFHCIANPYNRKKVYKYLPAVQQNTYVLPYYGPYSVMNIKVMPEEELALLLL